jgi:hypothetical protein
MSGELRFLRESASTEGEMIRDPWTLIRWPRDQTLGRGLATAEGDVLLVLATCIDAAGDCYSGSGLAA